MFYDENILIIDHIGLLKPSTKASAKSVDEISRYVSEKFSIKLLENSNIISIFVSQK